ncbi:MAG: hypothetical protein ACPGXX_02255, partial [Planctomycetaceae bacterium]
CFLRFGTAFAFAEMRKWRAAESGIGHFVHADRGAVAKNHSRLNSRTKSTETAFEHRMSCSTVNRN